MAKRTKYEKPLPEIRDHTKAFWEGCKRHELLIQRCGDCGTFRHPPRLICHECSSWNTEWVKITGRGIVYSYIVVRNHRNPAFEKDLPIALIELSNAGQVRMVSNLVECKPDDIKIGMPVEVVFDDVTDEITLPKFKPYV